MARSVSNTVVLAATNIFCRATLREGRTYIYPEATIQADAGAFAGVFTSVWQIIQPTFDQYYGNKPAAFEELARIVTPNKPDKEGFTSHARFWKNATKAPVTDSDSMRSLCRPLRNGLGHFNFRYVDMSPSEYFAKMRRATVPCAHALFVMRD